MLRVFVLLSYIIRSLIRVNLRAEYGIKLIGAHLAVRKGLCVWCKTRYRFVGFSCALVTRRFIGSPYS